MRVALAGDEVPRLHGRGPVHLRQKRDATGALPGGNRRHRLAAHEDQRPRDHPAAQHAVYLGVSQIEADVLAFADVPHALGLRRDRRDRTTLAGDDLLGE